MVYTIPSGKTNGTSISSNNDSSHTGVYDILSCADANLVVAMRRCICLYLFERFYDSIPLLIIKTVRKMLI